MTSAPRGPESDEFVRRLRAFTVASWRHGDRIARARLALAELAALAARAEGRPIPPVPDLGPHVLADQVVVLAADARRAGVPTGEVDRVIIGLRAGLGLR